MVGVFIMMLYSKSVTLVRVLGIMGGLKNYSAMAGDGSKDNGSGDVVGLGNSSNAVGSGSNLSGSDKGSSGPNVVGGNVVGSNVNPQVVVPINSPDLVGPIVCADGKSRIVSSDPLRSSFVTFMGSQYGHCNDMFWYSFLSGSFVMTSFPFFKLSSLEFVDFIHKRMAYEVEFLAGHRKFNLPPVRSGDIYVGLWLPKPDARGEFKSGFVQGVKVSLKANPAITADTFDILSKVQDFMVRFGRMPSVLLTLEMVTSMIYQVGGVYPCPSYAGASGFPLRGNSGFVVTRIWACVELMFKFGYVHSLTYKGVLVFKLLGDTSEYYYSLTGVCLRYHPRSDGTGYFVLAKGKANLFDLMYAFVGDVSAWPGPGEVPHDSSIPVPHWFPVTGADGKSGS